MKITQLVIRRWKLTVVLIYIVFEQQSVWFSEARHMRNGRWWSAVRGGQSRTTSTSSTTGPSSGAEVRINHLLHLKLKTTINHGVCLADNISEGTVPILTRGAHTFAFKFSLPESNLPCSFESKVCTIRYYIKVTIDVPYASPPQGMKYFTIIGPHIDCMDEQYRVSTATLSLTLPFNHRNGLLQNINTSVLFYGIRFDSLVVQ